MTDPTASGRAPLEALSDADRETRIEELLVSGLDEYFAGRLEQAVNVWTRVLFLDRSHDRARAYIDRARRALGERQRVTESLVHQGLQAFDDGDVDAARQLLTAAVERGAPQEQTLPVLRRIGLLDSGAQALPPALPRRPRWRSATAPVVDGGDSRRAWWWLAGLAVTVAALLAVWRIDDVMRPATTRSSYEPPASPLPVPGASEAYVRRARVLFASGRPADALRLLDRVDRPDAAFAEAQALRARIQDALLRATPGIPSPGTGGEGAAR